ncbi:MAG: hypothetical protein JO211_14745 [Acidobacteriaceae bacterium]|nr:hypothetical protein [Acidobacteriaceae bacterium]
MKFVSLVGILAMAGLAAAGQAPKPKSQKEVEALQKVQAAAQAHDYDAEINAINYVLENFADTEYKTMLLGMAVDAAQSKGDYAQTVAFGEQAIQANPNEILARVTVAESIAGHTRENDLDKDASIKKARDYANKALDLLKSADAPPAGIPPDRWPAAKKQLTGQAYDALGLLADLDHKYSEAVDDFKTAETDDPAPVSSAHLAKAYFDNKQYDDAIATADKVIAMPDAPAVVKQYAQQQKDNATKMKGAK